MPASGDIDLLSGDFFGDVARRAHAWMRREAPVYFDERNEIWGHRLPRPEPGAPGSRGGRVHELRRLRAGHDRCPKGTAHGRPRQRAGSRRSRRRPAHSTRGMRWSCSTNRPTSTKRGSTTPRRSTSAAPPTTTSRSGSAPTSRRRRPGAARGAGHGGLRAPPAPRPGARERRAAPEVPRCAARATGAVQPERACRRAVAGPVPPSGAYLSGRFPNRDVRGALTCERRAVPAGPPVTQRQAGELRHQVELRRPHVPERGRDLAHA